MLVDSKKNLIISPIMELPLNWGNISGVKSLPKEKLEDLSWAGEVGLGWKKITDPNLITVNVNEDWIGFQRENLKKIVSSKRKKMESEILTFGEKQIKLNERIKNSLSFKLSGSFNNADTLIWKFMNGTYEVTYSELKEIRDSIDSYLQECFNLEHKFSNIVDTTKEINDLFSINFSFNWPSTVR